MHEDDAISGKGGETGTIVIKREEILHMHNVIQKRQDSKHEIRHTLYAIKQWSLLSAQNQQGRPIRSLEMGLVAPICFVSLKGIGLPVINSTKDYAAKLRYPRMRAPVRRW
jgi:hypothetical protein